MKMFNSSGVAKIHRYQSSVRPTYRQVCVKVGSFFKVGHPFFQMPCDVSKRHARVCEDHRIIFGLLQGFPCEEISLLGVRYTIDAPTVGFSLHIAIGSLCEGRGKIGLELDSLEKQLEALLIRFLGISVKTRNSS